MENVPDFLKNNWLTFANFIILITFFVNMGKWQESIDNSIDLFHKHAEDKNMHMPLARKIEVFVPRVELDIRLQNMEKILEKIEKKLDKN